MKLSRMQFVHHQQLVNKNLQGPQFRATVTLCVKLTNTFGKNMRLYVSVLEARRKCAFVSRVLYPTLAFCPQFAFVSFRFWLIQEQITILILHLNHLSDDISYFLFLNLHRSLYHINQVNFYISFQVCILFFVK